MLKVAAAAAAALAFGAVVAGPAAAGPWEDGSAAYERHDYVTALRFWRPIAERGDVAAQAMLGAMYADGEGVPKDNTIAVNWLRKATDQNYPPAQYQLGRMYSAGRGVPKDPFQAAKCIDWQRTKALTTLNGFSG